MRVAWFPKAADLAGNPYWPRLQAELEALGVDFETSHASYWTTRRWLLKHRHTVDVLHFHFIQSQYVGREERASLRRLLKFASDLLLARLLGYRIVWTMHDLMPTWPKEPAWVERLARYVIVWLASDVMVHCQEAQRLLRSHFRRFRSVWVLPLPNYTDIYPNQISQAKARARLAIPQHSFVVGFIGGVRPNKGLEDLIAAFEQVKIPDAVLLIAGRPWPPQSYVDRVRRLAETNPQIVLRTHKIDDQELQAWLNAADVLAFPFRRVLTSSSVILAMSFGRSVIVPRLGCLPELVGTEAGFVYEAGDVAGLAASIELASRVDLSIMGASAALRANQANWRDLAVQTMNVYARRSAGST